MNTSYIKRIIFICTWTIPVLLFVWIVNRNLGIFDSTVLRCTAASCDSRIKSLFAREREIAIGTAKGSKESYRILSGNPLTFNTVMFRSMKKATVRMVYTGGSSGNRLSLSTSTSFGKKVNTEFADSTALISTLEGGWNAVKNGDMTLFQKRDDSIQQYVSVDDFFGNLPLDKKIGSYNIDIASRIELPLYTPATEPNVINLSIRGAHSFLTYVGRDEDLNVTFTMQDSNRNVGKDDVTFRVYYGSELVDTKVMKDDGSGGGDGNPSAKRDMKIELPRPDAGTYRIDITSATDDPFIRSVTTSQKYFMWNGTLYLAGSKEYRALGDVENTPLTLYVKGSKLTASTSHETALQSITVGSRQLTLKKTHTLYTTKLSNSDVFVPVTVQQRDIKLETDGVFVLSKDTSFSIPSKGIIGLTGASDPSMFDYVIAKYASVQHQGSWLVAEKTVEANLAKTIHFSIAFTPPNGSGSEALHLKELKVRLSGAPLTFADIGKAIQRILNSGK